MALSEDLREIFSAGLAAADPREAVLRSMRVEDGAVLVDDSRFEAERVFVFAAGKAGGAMARAAEELLGERLAGGTIVTEYGHEASSERLDVLFAAHPEPDDRRGGGGKGRGARAFSGGVRPAPRPNLQQHLGVPGGSGPTCHS